jgi:hypothetical protein
MMCRRVCVGFLRWGGKQPEEEPETLGLTAICVIRAGGLGGFASSTGTWTELVWTMIDDAVQGNRTHAARGSA